MCIRDRIKDISQNKIEVHGSIQLRDINKRLGINLSDSTVTTINGYILETLQEIPQAGMTFREDNIIIEVKEVNNNFVERAIKQMQERSLNREQIDDTINTIYKKYCINSIFSCVY